MNRLRPVALTSLLALLSISAPALAQEAGQGLSQSQVVALSMSQNPSLEAAMIDVQRAGQQVQAEDARFVPRLQLDAGLTHSESPRLQRNGDQTLSSSDTLSVGSQISHTFRTGTQLIFRLEGYRSTSTQQLVPGSSDSVTLGPSYGTVGRVTLLQPLLKGAGTDLSEAALRQARLSRTSAERARDTAASQVLRDALAAYWELWYRTRAVDIDEQALAFAKVQREDAARRAANGALAPVEVLSYETRVAELQEAVETGRAGRRQQAVELTRLLGTREFGANLYATSEIPSEARGLPLSREDAVMAALVRSPEVAQLEAEVAAAADRVKTAGESERPRLDLEAYAQSERLAYREIPPAFDHVTERPAFSAHVGVVFELPLSGSAQSADRRAAELAVDAARARLRDRRQQIESQVWSRFVEADTARRRVTLAESTVVLAKKQAEAQRLRYDSGAAILIEVQQAEDTLRRAELSVVRARTDFAQAALALQHLTGDLLAQYASQAPRTPTSTQPRAAYLTLERAGMF